jgi:hypothetical protein
MMAPSTLAGHPTFRSLDTIPDPNALRATASSTSIGNAVSENFRPPESYQWNLTVSREILKDTVLEGLLRWQPWSAFVEAWN